MTLRICSAFIITSDKAVLLVAEMIPIYERNGCGVSFRTYGEAYRTEECGWVRVVWSLATKMRRVCEGSFDTQAQS